MAMKGTTIRFTDDWIKLVQKASTDLGISLAQFVREAAVARAMISLNHEGASEVVKAIKEMIESEESRRLTGREGG